MALHPSVPSSDLPAHPLTPRQIEQFPFLLGVSREVLLNIQNCSIPTSVLGLNHCYPSLRKFALEAPRGEQTALGKNCSPFAENRGAFGRVGGDWMLAPAPQSRVMLLIALSGCTQWYPLHAASCFVPIFPVKSFLSPNLGSLENTFVKIFFTPER